MRKMRQIRCQSIQTWYPLASLEHQQKTERDPRPGQVAGSSQSRVFANGRARQDSLSSGIGKRCPPIDVKSSSVDQVGAESRAALRHDIGTYKNPNSAEEKLAYQCPLCGALWA
jgi:hypothetical protein